MNISIFGLGYVGCVSAACLAREGHGVIGVDVNPVKVDLINSGQSPIIEPGMTELMGDVVKGGKLKASSDPIEAVLHGDICLICVGTPANPVGGQNLSYLTRVCQDIGKGLAEKKTKCLVVIRSTVYPGTTEKMRTILEITSGKVAGKDFEIAVNPEFLREGSSIADFNKPPFIIIGKFNEGDVSPLVEMYNSISAAVFTLEIRSAEMFKYACNAYHALKIVFANEIGSMCKEEGIDALELMKIFTMDTILNVSPAYLKPGFAFGGSCLPKDIQSLLYHADQKGLSLPVLGNVLTSNQAQISRAISLVNKTGKKNIGFIGLSFKENTDDLRDSPVVKMVRSLIDDGFNVRVYDEEVNTAFFLGANRAFMEWVLPELPSILQNSIEAVIRSSDIVVLTQKLNINLESFCRQFSKNQEVLDLVGHKEIKTYIKCKYNGICW